MSTGFRSLRHRPGRAIPAIIVSIVLIGLGVGLTWVSVAKLVHGTWPGFAARLGEFVTGLTWQSPASFTTAGALVVIGIVLVVAAIIPGPRNGVFLTVPTPPVDPPTGHEEFMLTRKGLARLAASEADRVDGVSSVSATATEKRVRLTVTTSLRETAPLRDTVTRQVTARLDAVKLSRPPKVLATVRAKTE